MFRNRRPLHVMITASLLLGFQLMTAYAADDITEAFEFRDVWPKTSLLDETSKQNVKAWTLAEKTIVRKALKRAQAAAPGVFARATALGRIPVYRTAEETEAAAGVGGFDMFNIKFTETFFKSPENFRTVACIHELVHVLDAGRRISHSAAWAELMEPVFERVDSELAKRGIASSHDAGNQLSGKQAGAWGLPSFYARTNLTEALAEYVSHLAVAHALGIVVPETIPDGVRKFVQTTFVAREFKTDSAIIAYVKGRRLLQAGRSLQAMLAFTEAIKHDERFADAYFSRGVAFLFGRQYDSAISDFNRYAAISQEEATRLGSLLTKDERSSFERHVYLIFRGQAYGDSGHLDKAMTDFAEFLRLYPQNEAGYRNMAKELGKAGKLSEALTNVERALAIDPDNIDSRFLRARILFGTKEFRRAVQDYTAVLDERADYPEARVWRIRALSELGKFKTALADYDWMLERTPDNLQLRFQRGTLALKGRLFQEAVKDFTHVIDQYQKNPSQLKGYAIAYDRRASVYSALNEPEQAIADYNRLLETLPQYYTAYLKRGLLLANQQKHGEAIKDFDRFIEKSPDFAYAYYCRAHERQATRDFTKALADYDTAIKRDKTLTQAYAGRGQLNSQQGNLRAAITDFTRLIELKPDAPDGYLERARTLSRSGKYKGVSADYERAIEINPKYDQTYMELAWFYATCPNEKYRDGAKAVENATRSCELSDWKLASRLATLAAAYAESGDFQKAIQWQQRALKAGSKEYGEKWGFVMDLYKSGKPYRDKVDKNGDE